MSKRISREEFLGLLSKYREEKPDNYLEKQCPYCGHPVVRHPDYGTKFSCVKGWVDKCTNPECDYDDSDYYLPTLAY